tara:strand:+ start:694 stop:876 length:183 start_codon:yes stop_codon:yes gene_type:complete
MDKQHKGRIADLKSVGLSAEDVYKSFVDTKDAEGITLKDVKEVYGPEIVKAKKAKKSKNK